MTKMLRIEVTRMITRNDLLNIVLKNTCTRNASNIYIYSLIMAQYTHLLYAAASLDGAAA